MMKTTFFRFLGLSLLTFTFLTGCQLDSTTPISTITSTPKPTENPHSKPALLYHSVNYDYLSPAILKNDSQRLAYLQTLPFDGVNISSDAGWLLMQEKGKEFNLEYFRQQFSPLVGLNLGKLKHNFAIVHASKLGDFFNDSDWQVITRNFTYLAKVLKEVGIKGIFFDNEVYEPALPLFNWPDNCDHKEKSLTEYYKQARLRGQQIMQAMVQEYPEIVVFFAHGPYVSAPISGPDLSPTNPFVPRQSLPDYCELIGPFIVGFMEGMGTQAKVIDGGEEYKFRTKEDFSRSYQARKFIMGEQSFNCSFIPSSLRGSEWSKHINISYGIMADNWSDVNLNTSPEILQKCLTYALASADDYVWLYTESQERRFLTKDGINKEWLQAVWNAKNAVQK